MDGFSDFIFKCLFFMAASVIGLSALFLIALVLGAKAWLFFALLLAQYSVFSWLAKRYS
jgi:hypothetical protein